jgi:thiamine-monophosphate kinase
MPASEFDLIAAINERLPGQGERVRVPSGDDAAVVEPNGACAVSVDAVVEGVHFRLQDFGAPAVGRKALAAGLSDLAAMGALPGEAYVVVAAPAELEDEALLGIADGLAEVARRHGVTVGGGDLVASPVLMVSVTTVGYEPQGSKLVTRAGARAGDLIAVTGRLGGAAGALALIEGGGGSVAPELREAMLTRQLDPVPRLTEGLALATEGATAMIDVSDGLLADVGHIARASGVVIDLQAAAFTIPEAVSTVADALGTEPIRFVLTGGDDYALAATFSSASELPQGWTQIGTVRDAGTGEEPGVLVDGSTFEGPPGHRHFS